MDRGVTTTNECCSCLLPRNTVSVKNKEYLTEVLKNLAVLDSQLDRWGKCGGSLGKWKVNSDILKAFTTTEAIFKKAMATFETARKLCVKHSNLE